MRCDTHVKRMIRQWHQALITLVMAFLVHSTPGPIRSADMKRRASSPATRRGPPLSPVAGAAAALIKSRAALLFRAMVSSPLLEKHRGPHRWRMGAPGAERRVDAGDRSCVGPTAGRRSRAFSKPSTLSAIEAAAGALRESVATEERRRWLADVHRLLLENTEQSVHHHPRAGQAAG